MYNFTNPVKFGRIFLSAALITFSINTAMPLSATPLKASINDIMLIIRLEKLVEKIYKYEGQNDINKMIDVLLDFKDEVEIYTGKKISISDELEKIGKKIKKTGGKLLKDDIKAIRKMIKDREKKRKSKQELVLYCLEYGLSLDEMSDVLLYKKDDDKEESKMSVPVRLSVGVTMALCGVFLYILPIPACKKLGEGLIGLGVGFAIDATITREEEKEDNKDKEKKRICAL